jgi:hypothetical protein
MSSQQRQSTSQAWLIALTSGLFASVVTSVLALVASNMTITSERVQAQDDYLREERGKVYAEFQGCLRDIRDAFSDVFEYGKGYIPADNHYPAALVAGVHDGATCIGNAYIHVALLAPAAISESSKRVADYYGLRVQSLDNLLTVLAEDPIDPQKVSLANWRLTIRDIPVRRGSSETEPVFDVEVRLISQMRENLGNAATF